MTTRKASHAGSWYSASAERLSSELEHWLEQVPDKDVPTPGARVIIAPHAGYAYSGPAAAWAYKHLDLSKAKRIFLLGPSHALYLKGCALSKCVAWATPLGDLSLDQETTKELAETKLFDWMSIKTDETEHSMEMHIPYIYKTLLKIFKTQREFPPLIPILVGNTDAETEKKYGQLLAPYLKDPTSVFIVSSDFCHWGQRFQYTYYLPAAPSGQEGYSLSRRDKTPTKPPIHESIARLDKMAMDAIETGKHAAFLDNLGETGNTVCGRHPIGVVMAAIEVLAEQDAAIAANGAGRFKFIRYERSGDVEEIDDSSVSYASAIAVLP